MTGAAAVAPEDDDDEEDESPAVAAVDVLAGFALVDGPSLLPVASAGFGRVTLTSTAATPTGWRPGPSRSRPMKGRAAEREAGYVPRP